MFKLKVLFLKLFYNPTFIITIQNGVLNNENGIAPTGFVRDCKEIIKQNRIKSGIIYCTRYNKSRLKISGQVSEENKQRFRNAFSFHQ